MRPFDIGAATIALALLGSCSPHASSTSRSSARGPTTSGWESETSPSATSSSEREAQPAGAEAASSPGDARSESREALEVRRGRASYYSDSLAGRPTASGEPYDPARLTAASRDLPFGTIVRVVRVDTGESVVVRVNDRGPFRDHSRILDLSRAAAEELAMIRAGVVPIRAEILEWGEGRR